MITNPAGFRAAGVTAGLKPSGRPDLAVIVNDGPDHHGAAVFTGNRVEAAPVTWSRQVVTDGRVDAVVLNSGGANACTGAAGFLDTHRSAEHLAAAIATHTPLQHARVGVAVLDLATGAELFTHEPDKGLNLASNTKLLTSVAALGTLGAIGHKDLVFSTVGDRRVFARLPQGPVKPALALSLHSTFAQRRAELMPRAAHIDPAELVELGEGYARATGYPIQYQWTLLDGINDGDDELDRIAALLAGKYAVMNLIPYNTVEGFAFQRPSRERAETMTRTLCGSGVLAKLRQSAGQDIDGGCGQLRARRLA